MSQQSQWMLTRRGFLATSAVAVPVMFLAGCPSTEGTFQVLRVKAFSCNKLRAQNGETLTLRWDYDNADQLKMQKLRFLRLHLSGIAPELVDLELDQRSRDFTFDGPITVEIQATNEEVTEQSPFRPGFSAGLTVHQVQDLFVKATFQSASNTPGFPYLGYTQDEHGILTNNPVAVEFTQFAGFFDENGDGRIDPLVPFFAPSTAAFRGLSITGVEDQGFGFTEGPSFPFQSFSHPEIGRTNGMIYAGAIVMNGQDVPYKADDGNGFARVSVHTGQGAATPSTAVNAAGPPVSASLGFDPIFIGIPLLEAGQLNLADIQVGNLNQKLVATVTTNALLLASSSFGQVNTLTVNRSASLATGDIKGATAGITVTPRVGSGPFDALVGMSNLTWQTDYRKDTDLLQVISLAP
jgi:hypothetical protein